MCSSLLIQSSIKCWDLLTTAPIDGELDKSSWCAGVMHGHNFIIIKHVCIAEYKNKTLWSLHILNVLFHIQVKIIFPFGDFHGIGLSLQYHPMLAELEKIHYFYKCLWAFGSAQYFWMFLIRATTIANGHQE